MNTSRCFFVPLGLALASALWLPAGLFTGGLLATSYLSTASASTNDREYQMGDDAAESASNGSAVSTTFDSQGQLGMQQLHDLVATGSPIYRTVSGRPDGGTGLGIEFDGSSQFLRSARLGLPETSAAAIGGNFSGTLNYNRLNDRGFQFWVQPAATTAQSLVMDTNQHGARINADGNFSLQYAGASFDSNQAVVSGTWYHVMVVRPNGASDGARMYVDGLAVAAAPGGYDGDDTADLVVGANTAGDDGFGDDAAGFTGGTQEFFSGIIDDLTMFVSGDNSGDPGPPAGQDWGEFEFATDNNFATLTLSGVPGDIDNNGTFNEGDKAAFVAGWMNQNLVNGIAVPDLHSLAAGDLNSDGVTDIEDLVIIQSLLPAAGLSAITSADLMGIPEPSTTMLLLFAVTTTLSARATGTNRRR